VTFKAAFGRVSTREMRPSCLIFSSDPGPRKGSRIWHSLYTIPIAALLFVLFAPDMLAVAIAVKLTPVHAYRISAARRGVASMEAGENLAVYEPAGIEESSKNFLTARSHGNRIERGGSQHAVRRILNTYCFFQAIPLGQNRRLGASQRNERERGKAAAV